MSTSSYDVVSEREVTFTRVLDAPPALVWNAWSDVDQINRWWGPAGFTTTTHEFDFTPGGVWRYIMHGPNGTDYPNRVVFREIAPPSRIVYDNAWDLAEAPLEFSVVVTLVPVGQKTRLSLHMTFRDAAAFKTAVELYGVLPGGTQTLDRLAAHVDAIRASEPR